MIIHERLSLYFSCTLSLTVSRSSYSHLYGNMYAKPNRFASRPRDLSKMDNFANEATAEANWTKMYPIKLLFKSKWLPYRVIIYFSVCHHTNHLMNLAANAQAVRCANIANERYSFSFVPSSAASYSSNAYETL